MVECVSALAVNDVLQTHMYQSGILFHLLIFLFNYDYTLEEGGVERSEESNKQVSCLIEILFSSFILSCNSLRCTVWQNCHRESKR